MEKIRKYQNAGSVSLNLQYPQVTTGTQLGATGIEALGNILSGVTSNSLFGDSEMGRVFGGLMGSAVSSGTNTLANNFLTGTSLALGLGKNMGSSLAGAGAGLAANYIGKGITAAMGNSAVGRGVGTGVATALGTVGGLALSNLAKFGKIGSVIGKGASSINPYALAGLALGAALGAGFGPSKTLSGKYGTGATIAELGYDAATAAVNAIPVAGQFISAGMALNKGLTNLFGSTDGLTLQDTIIGNSWTGLLTGGVPFLNWINMMGTKTTGTFNNQSWLNTEKANAFMQNSFGDLTDRFDKARKDAGKTYGLFSHNAYSKDLLNINFANNAWNNILEMADLNEYQNIRSQAMTSINNQRYAQDIQGGWNPVYRGKLGMKIFNNATNHKIGMRLLSGAALVDSKQMILGFYNGGSTLDILDNLSRDEIIDLLNELISKKFLSGVGTEKADGIIGPKTRNAYFKYLSSQLQDTSKVIEHLMSTNDIKNYEANINNNRSNEEIINIYHLTNKTNIPYLVDDKVNNKLRVYINGKLLREYTAIHGKYSNTYGNTFRKKVKSDNEYTVKAGDFLGKIAKERGLSVEEIVKLNNLKNLNFITINQKLKLPGYRYETTEVNPDEMTITYVDSKGKIINKAGNLSTPAGIYFSSRAKRNYNGFPSFIRKTQLQVDNNSYSGIPASIHVRTITEGANTNGCTGISSLDMIDLVNLLEGYDNIPTYILPADNRNKFKIRNNKLTFSSHDVSKTPSHNEFDYTPISKMKYNNTNLDSELNNIIKKFTESLIKNKTQLQKDLGINNDTYNELMKYSLGILGVETNYGEQHSALGNFLRSINKFTNRDSSSPDYYSKYYTYNAKGDNNSVGLTQIRFKYLGNQELKLFKKYNIEKEDLVDSPEKAAIATMIKLAAEFKNRGNNFDKAVSSWNNRLNYISRVKEASKRFNLYLQYSTLKK